MDPIKMCELLCRLWMDQNHVEGAIKIKKKEPEEKEETA